MRINKYLAASGIASRRGSEEYIQEGRVKVNGIIVTDLSFQVPKGANVQLDGKRIRNENNVTVLLNKPKGVICSARKDEKWKTVFEYLPKEFPRMFYVGRLDVESEGMLVMTNNGDLSQKLTHPSHQIAKVYLVKLDQDFNFELGPRMKKGFLIEPGFARVESIYKQPSGWLKVTLKQGLKRQIRLMFLKLGYRVKALRRVQIGGLELGGLKPGRWRYLDQSEIRQHLLGVETERNSSTFKGIKTHQSTVKAGDQSRKPASAKSSQRSTKRSLTHKTRAVKKLAQRSSPRVSKKAVKKFAAKRSRNKGGKRH
ncbi:MAG: pseudouridine synthase [Verrucomicrobiota bacterium]